MTGPTLLSFGTSFLAVTQTLTRLTNVADYAASVGPRDDVLSHADLWQEAVRDGDTERLIEDIRTYDAFPVRHLDDDSIALLKKLAVSDPQLRAALQTSAETLERSIGVSIPLRMTVTSAGLPERGIALFLGARDEATVPAHSALQLFTVEPASEHATVRIATPRTLNPRGSTSAVREHFAREDIEKLAAYGLRGSRVTPFSAPATVGLPEEVTRIGRFTFLGLNRTLDERERGDLLSSLERHQSQVDVLVLGALSAAAPSFVDEAVVTLKPRLALLPVASAAAVHSFGYTTVVPVTASSPAVLELHPLAQSISVENAHLAKTLALKRQDRILDILEKIRPDVTRELVRTVYGDMSSEEFTDRSKGAWRRARQTMNGVVPPALRYLLLLDFDPNLFSRISEREEALARVVNEMADPRVHGDAGSDRVWAIKEILHRSGLLERRG